MKQLLLIFLLISCWSYSQEKDSIQVSYEMEGLTIEKVKTTFLIGRQRIKAKVGDVIWLKSIAFFPVTDKVLPECYPYLDDLVKALKANPKLKIEIQGHNCCESSPLVPLGKHMAETVYLYLIDKKIDKSRLSYTGFGGSRPIYPIPEQNNWQREANSRVEIKILEN